MPVAKSYQKFKIIGEPYRANGRMYVKLENDRQVRWYTDKEYEKMYGVPASDGPVKPKTQKEVLGFAKGYVTIFKGNTYEHLDWFRQSIARYNKFFGWYVISTEEVPEDLPIDLLPIKLEWEHIAGVDGESLGPESKVKAYVESLIYEQSDSEYVGEVGERIDVEVVIVKAMSFDGVYGRSTMHIMEDDEGNQLKWTTAAKTLVEGNVYHLRGTVKSHDVYKNAKQTVLTRCTIL
jgi:hypothetical protein